MTTGLFFEFHFPLALRDLIVNLLNFKNFDPKNPGQPIDTSTREWYSQPRPSGDVTTEVIQVNYKLPVSIAEIGAELTRTSMRVEFWYRDRSNNWMQLRDRQRVPVALNVSSSAAASWYKYTSDVYPVVAKSVQVRFIRTPDPDYASKPYSVGMRNLLVKRNVYERAQGVQALEEEQDVLGNVISKYVKDWDAAKAIDGDASTYWKSGPQPDPNAVVSCYLDIRSQAGEPKSIDELYIDPVHSGQHLNLYYSSDDTVDSRRLSPIAIIPDTDINTEWRQGTGRTDISGQTGQDALYQFTTAWGPQVNQSAWMGFEWAPDFDPSNGPSNFPILFKVLPGASASTTPMWSPEVTYDPGAGQFNLTFRSPNQNPITYSAPLTKVFKRYEPLRIVAGWAYNPSRVILQVRNSANETIASTVANTNTVPTNVTFDTAIQMFRFRGTLTAAVVKFEAWEPEVAAFFSNAVIYVSPDPVLPDDQGVIPPSSLDNAIYGVDWTRQSAATGGTDHTEYSSKEWTPIWRNYVAEKGKLYFPQMISAKFLKLEFTNLTEEPYPIYESGIDVSYKVFPISVSQTSTLGPRLFTGPNVGGLFGVANLNGIKSINWFNPFSIISDVLSIVTPQTEPVRIDTGPGYVTSTLPNNTDSQITKSYRAELSQRSIYRRDELDPYVLAQDQYYTTIKGEGLAKLQPYTNIPWAEIEAANPGALSHTRQLGSMPVRGTDYWIFPGQSLKIPAAVMTRLTDTSTVTERRATLESRVRFTTTAVHRYETRTVRRDAAIAYFAALREVIPMVSSYILGQDKDAYNFDYYTADQWHFAKTRTANNGAITSDGTGTATMYFNIQTYSNFAKLRADFRDSGLLRGEALWASANSNQLSPYAQLIPASPDGAMWYDNFVDWTDTSAQWGAPRGVVSINLDPDRLYQGKRVLHFRRAPGAGEAGISLQQQTNYVAGALVRLGCTIYKPVDNTNVILMRLVRISDGAVIYETPVDVDAGRWTNFQSAFVEVPGGTQSYRVQLVLTGDKTDDLYVNDVYTQLSHVRYFIQLGDGSQPLVEVTDLRYADGAAVVAPSPVNQATVRVSIVSPKGYAFGSTITPMYLQ